MEKSNTTMNNTVSATAVDQNHPRGSQGSDIVDPLEIIRYHEIHQLSKSRSGAGDDFNDIISSTVRDGTQGFALASVILVSVCMSLVSLLLIVQYQPPLISLNSPSGSGSEQDLSCNIEKQLPLWADLIHQQMQVIQNLVHASLLGGAAFVAAFRGDPVWLYFCRNCCFFFGLSAISYMVLSLWEGLFGMCLAISSLLSLCCILAFARLETVRLEMMRLVLHYTQGHETNYPKYLPATRSQLVLTTLISRLSGCLQGTAVLYSFGTTAATILEKGCSTLTSIDVLEKSYSQGAHQAFLLSLLFLVATFPGNRACTGGALIASAWRVLIAIAYVPQLAVEATADFNVRVCVSLGFTALELVINVPIAIAALMLAHENSQSSLLGDRVNSKVKYSRIEEKEHYDDEEPHDNNNDFESDEFSRRIHCQTMRCISNSGRFSPRQRRGAFIVSVSSVFLLLSMTMECLLMLSFSGSSEYTSDVYKWGMHVSAMYLFCTIMSVTCPEVYARARVLLLIACPVGSLIGSWQLRELLSSPHGFDITGWAPIAAGVLFGFRILFGVCQSVGLAILDNILPQSDSAVGNSCASFELSHRISRARFVLHRIYIPVLILYVAAEASFASCSEPLISPSTPDCQSELFILAPVWPGLGTFFHFGGLLVIFSSDALSRALYPPSLAIAHLFAAHIAILLAGDLILFKDDGLISKVKNSGEILQYWFRALWFCAAFGLWISLHRLWKLRNVGIINPDE